MPINAFRADRFMLMRRVQDRNTANTGHASSVTRFGGRQSQFCQCTESRPAAREMIRMDARETAELLIQAARVAQAARTRDELTPAEWMALRFFARANP